MNLLALALACTSPVPAQAHETHAALSLPDVAERAVRGVVSITTSRALPPQLHMQGKVPQGVGSGVVIDSDGVIVTNHHVVDGAERVDVTLHDGRVLEATVVGSDPRADVAVLRLTSPPGDLTALEWGSSDALRLGETVLAIGNPFGIGHTLTRGIVSAKGRAMGVAEYEDFIQTDAAINPGNSGGALVDLEGRLIGIPTAIFSKTGGFSGISFAIPSRMAHAVTDDILEDGQVDRGWLGVAIAEVDGGVVLQGVEASGAASLAGLQTGDVILAFNGTPVTSLAAFRSSVALAGAGEAFDVRIERDGAKRVVKGTLGRRPDDP
ncbi:MAG: trypsin-like peptidase domain-containing protein [Myxococcales bacterium]|nr:trypsin-like peptidase domain-containing protein [Myxococcales bacterium]